MRNRNKNLVARLLLSGITVGMLFVMLDIYERPHIARSRRAVRIELVALPGVETADVFALKSGSSESAHETLLSVRGYQPTATLELPRSYQGGYLSLIFPKGKFEKSNYTYRLPELPAGQVNLYVGIKTPDVEPCVREGSGQCWPVVQTQ